MPIHRVFHDTSSTETLKFFSSNERAFYYRLRAGQLEHLSVSRILFCICFVLSLSVERDLRQ